MTKTGRFLNISKFITTTFYSCVFHNYNLHKNIYMCALMYTGNMMHNVNASRKISLFHVALDSACPDQDVSPVMYIPSFT